MQISSKKIQLLLGNMLVMCCDFILGQQQWPWQQQGQYSTGTLPMVAHSSFAWSHECNPSSDVTCSLLHWWHGCQNRQQCWSIFLIIDNKVASINLLLHHQFKDLIESFWPSPQTAPCTHCSWDELGLTNEFVPQEGWKLAMVGLVVVVFVFFAFLYDSYMTKLQSWSI